MKFTKTIRIQNFHKSMVRRNSFLINKNCSKQGKNYYSADKSNYFHKLALENKEVNSNSNSENFFLNNWLFGKINMSTGLILARFLVKKNLIRRLIRFLSVAFAKTFLGTIKPKRGEFWLAWDLTLMRTWGVWYDLLFLNASKSFLVLSQFTIAFRLSVFFVP